MKTDTERADHDDSSRANTGAGSDAGSGAGSIDAGSGAGSSGAGSGAGSSGAGSIDAGTGARIPGDTGAPKKRGRGRPRLTTEQLEQRAKKTGRDAGTGTGKKERKAAVLALDGATLARNLQFGHAVAATALKIPALEITEPEAKKMAEALAELATHYDVEISKKTLAWLQLAAVGGAIYGPRVLVIAASKKIKKAEQRAQAQAPAINTAATPGAGVLDLSGGGLGPARAMH